MVALTKQSSTERDPAPGVVVFVGQVVHDVTLVSAEYVPMGQSVHGWLPVELYWPAGHGPEGAATKEWQRLSPMTKS